MGSMFSSKPLDISITNIKKISQGNKTTQDEYLDKLAYTQFNRKRINLLQLNVSYFDKRRPQSQKFFEKLDGFISKSKSQFEERLEICRTSLKECQDKKSQYYAQAQRYRRQSIRLLQQGRGKIKFDRRSIASKKTQPSNQFKLSYQQIVDKENQFQQKARKCSQQAWKHYLNLQDMMELTYIIKTPKKMPQPKKQSQITESMSKGQKNSSQLRWHHLLQHQELQQSLLPSSTSALNRQEMKSDRNQ